MENVESAGLTDVGLKRRENQDALLIDEGLGLYVVSDGMGGHRAGEVASRLVVDAMQHIMSTPLRGVADDEMDPSLSWKANMLIHAITIANQQVYQSARTNASYQGMGATVSAVMLTEKSLIAANVGDSPIYLIQKGRIERLSVPHTLMDEHAAADPEGKAFLAASFKHVLTRAVGTRETVQADLCELQWFPGDIVVIGSDGLSNQVDPDEICHIARRLTPKEACRRMVDLANQRGGEDNITVIVLKTQPKQSLLRRIVYRFNHLIWRE